MNDEQLLELLKQKTPQELSLEEIELLRSRLAESSELRDLLTEQLQMEGYLAEALGRVNVSAEDIFARVQSPPRSGWPLLSIFGGVVCLTLIALVGAVFVTALRTQTEDRNQTSTVAADNNKPSELPATEPDENVPDDGKPKNGNEKNVAAKSNTLPLTIEAEDFVRSSNVVIETIEIDGDKLTVVRSDESSPGSVEYEFELPRKGKL